MLKQSISEESDYIDVVEELDESQEDKGKALMYSASHAIREQGSSCRAKPPDILRALLPLQVDDDLPFVLKINRIMKILIGTQEVDVGNQLEWPTISIKPKLAEPPDECVDKKMIYMPPPEDLEISDHVEIWTNECRYEDHDVSPVWVGPFIVEGLDGPYSYWVSTPLGCVLLVPVYYEHVRRCYLQCHHPPN